MKSIALILINQKKAFENIGSEFSDKLHRKSIYLFGFYGMVKFFFDFSKEDSQNEFFIIFLELIMSVGFSILIFMCLSLLIYWSGKKLNGIAEDVDIESIVAHSLIPIIIGLLIVMILKNSLFFKSDWNNPYSRNSVLWISWLLYIKILLQGSKRFNKFSLGKSLITISPVILINLGALIIYFIFQL